MSLTPFRRKELAAFVQDLARGDITAPPGDVVFLHQDLAKLLRDHEAMLAAQQEGREACIVMCDPLMPDGLPWFYLADFLRVGPNGLPIYKTRDPIQSPPTHYAPELGSPRGRPGLVAEVRNYAADMLLDGSEGTDCATVREAAILTNVGAALNAMLAKHGNALPPVADTGGQDAVVGEIVPRYKGFSIVQLHCADLPVGTKLYATPPPSPGLTAEGRRLLERAAHLLKAAATFSDLDVRLRDDIAQWLADSIAEPGSAAMGDAMVRKLVEAVRTVFEDYPGGSGPLWLSDLRQAMIALGQPDPLVP